MLLNLKANKDIKLYAAGKGVTQKRIAQVIGIAETSLARKLSQEADPEVKERIIRVINMLAEQTE